MNTPNHYFSGIYKFQFPFNDDHRNFGYCDVEISIGDQGLNIGTPYLATVFIKSAEKSYPSVEHYFEKVASKIRLCYFDSLLCEKPSTNFFVSEDRIRWIQSVPFYRNGIWKQVTMKWSNERREYCQPKWLELEPRN